MSKSRPEAARPAARCPVHPECRLEGGPVRWRCPRGHAVPAADIDREYHPPVKEAAA